MAADPGTLIPVLPPVLAFVHLPGLLAAVVVLGGTVGGIVRYPRALLTIVSVVVVGIDGTYGLIQFLLIAPTTPSVFNPASPCRPSWELAP